MIGVFFRYHVNYFPYYTTKNENSNRSVHCPVVLQLKTTDFIPGRRYWKLSDSLIDDKLRIHMYIQTIKTLVVNAKIQYSILVYNINNIQNIPEFKYSIPNIWQPLFDTLLIFKKEKIYLIPYVQTRSLKEEVRRNNLKRR